MPAATYDVGVEVRLQLGAVLRESGATMAMFSVRIPDDLAGRFDAAAAERGGRSALLRQLISASGANIMPRPRPGRARRDASRIMVRLSAVDTAGLDAEASAMGLPRAAWVAALVRRRVQGEPTFSHTGELSLAAIQGELRRIGVNVNQITRALNTAVLEGRVLDLEIHSIDDARLEIRQHMLAVREAIEGNLAYWSVEL